MFCYMCTKDMLLLLMHLPSLFGFSFWSQRFSAQGTYGGMEELCDYHDKHQLDVRYQ